MKNNKVMIADRPGFNAHIEIQDDVPFLHTEVHEWSKQTMKEMQLLFDMVVEKCEELGFEHLSFYGKEPSVKLAESFAPLDELNDLPGHKGYYVGTWYV